MDNEIINDENINSLFNTYIEGFNSNNDLYDAFMKIAIICGYKNKLELEEVFNQNTYEVMEHAFKQGFIAAVKLCG